MSRQIHVFDRPDRFVAGTVGEPGERTFFLQASAGSRIVTVALEKQQVAMLADRLERLLDEVSSRTGQDLSASASADVAALATPIDEEFRVSAMALAWNGDAGLVVIEAQAPAENDEAAAETLLEDTEDGPDALRVLISPPHARAFVERARQIVAAGRPPCPLCSLPLDPAGHICPRQNGYHRGIGFNG
jgi:uncharacterized repeat protein (TIGR03847 family)